MSPSPRVHTFAAPGPAAAAAAPRPPAGSLRSSMPGWLLGILLAVYVAAAVGLVAVFLLEPDDSTFVGSCVAFFQDEVPQRLERLARR